jgi:hypothetical protein
LTLTNITNNFNSFADNVTNISFVGDYFSYQNAFISNFEIFNNFFNSNFINLIIIFIFSIKFQKFNFKILKLRNFNILINLIFTTFIFKLFLSLIFHFSGNLNLFPRADNHLLVYLTALLFIIILQNYDLKIATSNYIKNIVILFSICVILIVKIDNFYFNIFPVTGNPAWIGIFSQ